MWTVVVTRCRLARQNRRCVRTMWYRGDMTGGMTADGLAAALRDIESWRDAELGFLTFLDDGYPAQLRAVHDLPPVLFHRGRLVADDVAVSVVGSRGASERGLPIARSATRLSSWHSRWPRSTTACTVCCSTWDPRSTSTVRRARSRAASSCRRGGCRDPWPSGAGRRGQMGDRHDVAVGCDRVAGRGSASGPTNRAPSSCARPCGCSSPPAAAARTPVTGTPSSSPAASSESGSVSSTIRTRVAGPAPARVLHRRFSVS